jgi:hypothetical protein
VEIVQRLCALVHRELVDERMGRESLSVPLLSDKIELEHPDHDLER